MEILPIGHPGGGVYALTTAFISVDLTAFVNRYVKISCPADTWFVFVSADNATVTPVTTATANIGGATPVADDFAANTSVQRTVDKKYPILRLAVKAGTADARLKILSRLIRGV